MAADTILNKLNVRVMGLELVQLDELADQATASSPIAVARFYGAITGTVADMGTYGPFHRFKGDFFAVNLLTGEEFRSAALLLPPVADEPLANMYEQAVDEGAKSVRFAFELTITPNTSKNKQQDGRKYVWAMRMLTDRAAADPLQELIDSVEQDKPRQLIAPKK